MQINSFPWAKGIIPVALLGSFHLNAQEEERKLPNIIIIMTDDMGYSDLGCYGGEINTPNIDKLAENGLRFTNFYNCGRSWPTRASLLSGYYPNAIGMDHPRKPSPSWVKTLPQYLKGVGYKTYHSGKWHYMNKPQPRSDGGFDQSCMLARHGFYFYDYDLVLNDQPPERHTKKDDKFLTTVLTDHALSFLDEHHQNDSDKPFFLYLAYFAPHFPLQARSEDIDKYRDRYIDGWDQLKQERWKRMKNAGLVNHSPPPREPYVNQTYEHLMTDKILLDSLGTGEVLYPVAWESLSDKEKQFQSMKMAIHAAMVDRIDQEVGRVVGQLKSMGVFENTLIFFLSDNGASAEIMIRGNGHDRNAEPGSAETFLCLGPGWANASNTPFRRYKSWTHEGGVATPLIVHWPQAISSIGALRDDPGHVIDFVPTLLDLVGLQQESVWQGSLVPTLPGKSLVPAFFTEGSVNHEYLYFNHHAMSENGIQNRALRMGHWKIVSSGTDNDKWSLYNLENDRGEQIDLSEDKPELLKIMFKKWMEVDEEYENISNQGKIIYDLY